MIITTGRGYSIFATNIFTFYVGSDHRLFQVHGNIFEEQSEPLNKLINGEFSEASSAEAWLEEEEPAVCSAGSEFAYSLDYNATLNDIMTKTEDFPNLLIIAIILNVSEREAQESCILEKGTDNKMETETNSIEDRVVPTVRTKDIALECDCWKAFLFHIKVFCFADRYLDTLLKKHACKQFEATLAQKQDHVESEEFVE